MVKKRFLYKAKQLMQVYSWCLCENIWWKGFFKRAKVLFKCGTGAIFIGCFS